MHDTLCACAFNSNLCAHRLAYVSAILCCINIIPYIYNKDDNSFQRKHVHPSSRSAAFAATVSEGCIVCKMEKHPLFTCPEFRAKPRDKMVHILRSNGLCLNCLKPGHFVKNCPSSNRCKKCQRSHHTLIHEDTKVSQATATVSTPQIQSPTSSTQVESNAHASCVSTGTAVPNTLLMTCQVKVNAPEGTSIKARALLDSGSTTSFVSERIVQALGLIRRSKCLTISGIGGLSHKSPLQSVSTFEITSLYSPKSKYSLTAIVVPRITCDLPFQPVHMDPQWSHLSGLALATPTSQAQEESTCYLGQTSMQTYYCTAGGVVLKAHPLHLKHNSVGFSREEPLQAHTRQTKAQLPHIILQLLQVTTSCVCSGKLKNHPRITRISLWKSAQLFNISRKIATALLQVDSSSLYPGIHRPSHSVNQGRRLLEDSSHLSSLSTPRASSRSSQQ